MLLRELDELRAGDLMARAHPGPALLSARQFEHHLVTEMARSLSDPTSGGTLLMMNLNALAPSPTKLRPAAPRGERRSEPPGGEPGLDVAKIVDGELRTPDVCCRGGGDGYLVLLPAADRGEAHLIMARLRVAVIREGARRDLPITLAIGCASWPADAQNPVDLVKLGRSALAAEKRRLRATARRPPPPAQVGGTLALVR